MIASSKPRTQRLFRFGAPMHMRQHFAHAHLDKSLKARLGLKKRAIQLSKGDTVKVMSGSKRGTSGKVIGVSLRTGRILIDSVVRKNAKGKELNVPISVSNVYITDIGLTDKLRAARLGLKAQAQKAQPKQETKKAKEKEQQAQAPEAKAAPGPEAGAARQEQKKE